LPDSCRGRPVSVECGHVGLGKAAGSQGETPVVRPAMTAVSATVVTDQPIPAQRQAAAREAYRASLAEGVPLTGAELGGGSSCHRGGVGLASPRCTPRRLPVATAATRRRAVLAARTRRIPSMHPDGLGPRVGRPTSRTVPKRQSAWATAACNCCEGVPYRNDVTARRRQASIRQCVASRRWRCWRWRWSPRSPRTITSGRWPSWRARAGGRGSCRCRLTASSWPRPCPCSCGAEPTYQRARLLGHPCSPGSARASPRTSPPLTPRWWGASLRPGPPLLCSSLGSC
jgi:hypothetical protein